MALSSPVRFPVSDAVRAIPRRSEILIFVTFLLSPILRKNGV